MRTVLVIEDNRDIRENTSEILELAGYAVLCAENGREGIQMAVESVPDIILCDIMMPEVSGYEVLKSLKGDKGAASIPFIFVTASGEKSEVELAMNMGANGYVRKPYDAKDLLEMIKKCLSK